jgi:predicted nucleotidyltransferase
MNMRWHDLCTINELAASFAKLEGVEALVLAGSTTTGMADEESDYDLYAYTRETVPVEFRGPVAEAACCSFRTPQHLLGMVR